MKYIELTITCDEASVEALVEELSAKGYTDVLISDPREIRDMLDNLEDTEWYDIEQVDLCPDLMKPSVKLYFSGDEKGIGEAEVLRDYLQNSANKGFTDKELEIDISERDDGEWKDNWKEYFKATKVSDRVIVMPTWDADDGDGDFDVDDGDGGGDCGAGDAPITIRLDPGMAFGTGTHETTALAIRLLEKYVKPGSRVLDVGTGSGILAILATKLGAGDVLGIDIDEDAVETARINYAENITNNADNANNANNNDDNADNAANAANMSRGSADFIVGDLTEDVDYQADVVVANLLTDLVIRFTPDARKHLAPGGVYISSGILAEHEDRVVEALRNNGFRVLEVMQDGEWISIVAELSDARC